MYVGIDPGKNGAIACIDDENNVEIYSMPENGRDFCEIIDDHQPSLACVEKVHSMPKQGVASSFKFGMNFGGILWILDALECPYVLALPVAWKRKVLAGLDWKGNKKCSIKYCRSRFPGTSLKRTQRSKIDSIDFADALCMAEYARIFNGEQK